MFRGEEVPIITGDEPSLLKTALGLGSPEAQGKAVAAAPEWVQGLMDWWGQHVGVQPLLPTGLISRNLVDPLLSPFGYSEGQEALGREYAAKGIPQPDPADSPYALAMVQSIKDVGHLSDEVVSGLSTPDNLAILGSMLLTSGLSTPAAVGKMAQGAGYFRKLQVMGRLQLLRTLVDAGFTSQQAIHSADAMGEALSALREGDTQRAGKLFASGTVQGTFALLSAIGAAKGMVDYADVRSAKGDYTSRLANKPRLELLATQLKKAQDLGQIPTGRLDFLTLLQKAQRQRAIELNDQLGRIYSQMGRVNPKRPYESPAVLLGRRQGDVNFEQLSPQQQAAIRRAEMVLRASDRAAAAPTADAAQVKLSPTIEKIRAGSSTTGSLEQARFRLRLLRGEATPEEISQYIQMIAQEGVPAAQEPVTFTRRATTEEVAMGKQGLRLERLPVIPTEDARLGTTEGNIRGTTNVMEAAGDAVRAEPTTPRLSEVDTAAATAEAGRSTTPTLIPILEMPPKHTSNILITDDMYAADKRALFDMSQRVNDITVLPEAMARATRMGAYWLERGVRTFAEWSEKVVQGVGEWVRPHLRELWNNLALSEPPTAKAAKLLEEFDTLVDTQERNMQAGDIRAVAALAEKKADLMYQLRAEGVKTADLVQRTANRMLEGPVSETRTSAEEVRKPTTADTETPTSGTTFNSGFDPIAAARAARDLAADILSERKGDAAPQPPTEAPATYISRTLREARERAERSPNNVIRDMRVRTALSATRTDSAISGWYDWLRDVLVYKPWLKNQPEFKNDVRLQQDSRRDAQAHGTANIVYTVGQRSNDRPTMPLENVELLGQLAALEDFAFRDRVGEPLPLGLTSAEVKAALADVHAAVAQRPAVQEAYRRHMELVNNERRELIKRGKLPPDFDLSRPYFPHQVLDYTERWGGLTGVPYKVREPNRAYVRRAHGSERLIESDYIKAMHDHWTRVYLDNTLSDFILTEATKYDRIASMTKDQLAAHIQEYGAPQHNRFANTEADGTHIVGWSPDGPGSKFYLPSSPIEQVVKELMDELTGHAGESPAGIYTRRGKRVYLLPEEIANELESFRRPIADSLYNPMRAQIAFWKRLTLDFAGVAFQISNLAGDLINLYKTDPAAFSNLWEAAQMLGKEHPSARQQLAIDLAKQHRVLATSGFFSGEVIGGAPIPEHAPQLLHLYPGLWNKAKYGLSLFERFSAYRESVPRLAKFITDLDRISRGEHVVRRDINIAGLDPQSIAAAGKVAREFTVDYGAVSDEFRREISGWLLPFSTFYIHNFKNWSRYVRDNPTDAAVKFGIPLAAMWAWNNGNAERRKIEAGLDENDRIRPHIITGYSTEDGKPIILSMQTPVDMAARIFSLDRLPRLIEEVQAGRMTPADATEDAIKGMASGPFRAAGSLLNPIIKTIFEAGIPFTGIYGANTDFYSGRAVVREGLKGTPQANQLQVKYFLEKLMAPFSAYIRAERSADADNPIITTILYPLDPRRAFVRTPNPETEQASRAYESHKAAAVDYLSGMDYLEDAYVDSRVSGNMTTFQSKYREFSSKKEGPKFPVDMVMQRMLTPRVQLRIARGQLRAASTDTERAQLQLRIKQLERMALIQDFQGIPLGARPQTYSVTPQP